MAVASVDDRELIKAMSWFDGFVVALANPSFLLTALGGSVLSLGGWGATMVWTFSVLIGALHNNIYAEVAAMFPKLSGGVAVYAHEAWKRYTSFVGPIAAVGYWLGWSVVLSLNGAIVGYLLQARFFPEQHVRQHHERLGDRQLLLQSGDPDRRRRHHRHLGGQRLGRPTGRLDRLRHRRAAALPALRPHRRPVHHGRLELGQPPQPDRLRQLQHLRDQGLGRLAHLQRRLAARDHLALPHVLVVLRLRVLRLVRAGVPRSGAGHRQGAARRRRVRRVRLRAPADRRPGRVRRQERHAREHADVLRRHVLEAARRHDGRPARDHALRRHRALHEHGHDGRVTSPLRDLPGRHDDPLAGQAQPQQRARQRDDAGRGAQPRPAVHRDRCAGRRRLSQDPRGLELRLRDRAHLRDLRVPAAAQGSARLAEADPARPDLDVAGGALPRCSTSSTSASAPGRSA